MAPCVQEPAIPAMARRPVIVSGGDTILVVLACWRARFATGHRSRRRAHPRCLEGCPEGAGEAGGGRGSGAAEWCLGARGRRRGRVAQHGAEVRTGTWLAHGGEPRAVLRVPLRPR